MKTESDGKLVTIYVNSTDQWHGQSLYAAIVQMCKNHGIAGTTVTRAVEGYGGSGHIHTIRLLELSENLPVRIEIVDTSDRVAALLAALEPMLGEGLVTIADVHMLRYRTQPKH